MAKKAKIDGRFMTASELQEFTDYTPPPGTTKKIFQKNSITLKKSDGEFVLRVQKEGRNLFKVDIDENKRLRNSFQTVTEALNKGLAEKAKAPAPKAIKKDMPQTEEIIGNYKLIVTTKSGNKTYTPATKDGKRLTRQTITTRAKALEMIEAHRKNKADSAAAKAQQSPKTAQAKAPKEKAKPKTKTPKAKAAPKTTERPTKGLKKRIDIREKRIDTATKEKNVLAAELAKIEKMNKIKSI